MSPSVCMAQPRLSLTNALNDSSGSPATELCLAEQRDASRCGSGQSSAFVRGISSGLESSLGASGSITPDVFTKLSVLQDKLDAELQEQEHLMNFAVQDALLRGEDRAPRQELYHQIAGFGRAPWEIHRPQKALIALTKRGLLGGGRLLDLGCGIGDNALFLARYTKCSVTGVDMVPRCIEFCKLKAGLREVSSVNWVVANLLQELEGTPLEGQHYDVLLDAMTFHGLNNRDREAYVRNLNRLSVPGTKLVLMCYSEKELTKGGPRRIHIGELYSVFNQAHGWQVNSVEDTMLELHPNIFGGRAAAYLALIERVH